MTLVLDALLKLRNSLNTSTDQKFVTVRELGEKIPKIIHQTYYLKPSDPAFPEELRANITDIQNQNPDWEYRFYDDADIEKYIKDNTPELFDYYQKLGDEYGAARADFFRYVVIYCDGGVYLDVKSLTKRPLNEVLLEDDKYVLSYWPEFMRESGMGKHQSIKNPDGEFQQWHVISVSGHPFLETVINNVCNNINHYNPVLHDCGAWGVLNLTGPIAYSEAIFPILERYPHRLLGTHREIGLKYCAVSAEKENPNDHMAHVSIFSKRHYTKLKTPVVKSPFHTRAVFALSRPIVAFLKFCMRQKHKRANP